MAYANTKDIALAFTANIVGTGVAIQFNLTGENRMVDTFSIQQVGVGAAPTALTGALEVSLDGTNWFSIQALSHTTNGDVFFVTGKLAQRVRVNISALTLGTATSINIYLLAS